jgi:hypothetical protein
LIEQQLNTMCDAWSLTVLIQEYSSAAIFR